VNTEALSKWVGHIPSDVISDMAEIAPMLARLGYDPDANPPDYTKAEPMVFPHNHSQVKNDFILINRKYSVFTSFICYIFFLCTRFDPICGFFAAFHPIIAVNDL